MKKKKQKQEEDKKSWVSQLLSLLFAQKEFHVPSKKLKHYRNKITYNLPLINLSTLADENLNAICQAIDDWIRHSNRIGDIGQCSFREVMAKCSRDGSTMIRLTVQRNTDTNNVKENDTSAAAVKEEKSDAVNAVNNWDKATQQLFVSHLVHLFPSITCVCYNETHDQSRPTKDDPLHLIHGQYRYVLEQTPTGLSYQISPDAFCEINHEVEDLQYAQTVEWINKQEYQNAILVCSGRDVNSYGLGFGSILNQKGEKLFSEVVAVQHCPLVAIDAIANYKRHENEIKATVLHLSKDEMASGVTLALDQALERNNYPPVVVVTTGGRKGLNHTYLNLLNNHKSVQCIVYNSCSTKSLEVDIEGFMSGPEGYYIDNFRSYDFFAGTKYTASVTHLVRRPRTLVLPVGPAGVGKSTLATMLVEKSPAKSFLWWHRDLEFANLRNANVSMTKTKSLIHDKMLLFLNGECKSIRFVDSTNGNNGARALYVQETRPELLLVVVLSPSTEQNGNKDDIVDILLERTRNRLEGGNDTHPSFPTTVDEQRQKHKSILKGIEYPSASEVAGIGVHDLRKMIVHCNPRDESKLASLPFEIFLVYSISSYLYQGLCRDRFNNTAITC